MATKKQPTPEEEERPLRLSRIGAEYLESVLAAFEGATARPELVRERFNLKHATDEDLERAAFVADAVWLAIAEDNPSVWKGIAAAFETLHGARGQNARRNRVLLAVEAFIDCDDWPGPSEHSLIRQLSLYEQRFAQLKPEDVTRVIGKARPGGAVRKGGAGNVGCVLSAARLSVAVGAFSDADEAVSKRAFLQARAKARVKPSPKRKR